jgi:hypothetical protein
MEDPCRPALSGSGTAALAQEKMATAPNRLAQSAPSRSEFRGHTGSHASQDAENEHPAQSLVDTERKFIRIRRLTVVKYTVQGRADPAQATGMFDTSSLCLFLVGCSRPYS